MHDKNAGNCYRKRSSDQTLRSFVDVWKFRFRLAAMQESLDSECLYEFLPRDTKLFKRKPDADDADAREYKFDASDEAGVTHEPVHTISKATLSLIFSIYFRNLAVQRATA